MRSHKRKNRPPIYTLDTETVDFGGHAVMCTVADINSDYTNHFTSSLCIEYAFDEMISRHPNVGEFRLYIHNAAFDVQRFTTVRGLAASFQLNGTAFISGHVKYRNVSFFIRDSMSLLPNSLAKLAKSFAPEFAKIEHNFDDGFDIENPDHIAYAIRDVVALKHVLINFASNLNIKVDDLPLTASSLAFKRMLSVMEEYHPRYKAITREFNELFRRYYYGGRIFIRDGHCIDHHFNTISFDITSSYPAAMRNRPYPYPGIKPKRTIGHIPHDAYVFVVTIRITNYVTDLPILPFREKSDDAPIYPLGSFTSHVCDSEYKFLIENQSDSFDNVEIIDCYYWRKDQCGHIFKEHVDKAYSMKKRGDDMNKAEKGSGDALREVAKLLLNSPYGKLAQRYIDDDNEGRVGFGEHCNEINPFSSNSNKQTTDHRNVHLAALITASARVKLYRMINYYGAKNTCYCDTDSVKIISEAFNNKEKFSEIGGELGEWKNEGEYNNLRVIAPKVYAAVVSIDSKTYNVVKSKGTPTNFIKSIVVDGKILVVKKDGYDKLFNAVMSHKESVVVKYEATPNKLKTFINTGKYASEKHRTVTSPTEVKAMHFNTETRTYHFRNIGA